MQVSFFYAIVAFTAIATSTAAPTSAGADELAARQVVPIPRRFLPAGGNKANWRTYGCAADLYPDARRLNGGLKEIPGSMTIGQCLAFCDSRLQRYAGLEFGYQCFCGPQLDFGVGLTSPAANLALNNGGCTTPAPGNTTQNAGGPNHLLVFESLVNGPATQPATVSGFNFVGCFPEKSNARLLPLNYYGLTANSIETCIARCKSTGNDLASLEFGSQCHCGKSVSVVLPPTLDTTKCEYVCSGDDNQLCGGLLAQALYRDSTVVVPPVETPGPEITNPGPIATSRGDYEYVGCFAETSPIRVLAYNAGTSAARTNAGCARNCANLDYRYSSTQNGNTCRCGNTSVQLTESTACNLPCTGVPTQICGGNGAQSLYAQVDAPTPNTEVAVNALA